jgi:2-oxoglutarate ferredoxin oxidoreductase subunit alpha
MSTLETASEVVIRFAGDSGDGMQTVGDQFTRTTALFGNDLATFPDYPAEIRAPAGTRAGVSGFQLQFASHDIFTPGDLSDVLVAMNPAALITNLKSVKRGGLVVVNTDRWTSRDLEKAGLASDPLTDGTVDDYHVVKVQIGNLTRGAVAPHGVGAKDADRCKNFFALGMMYWLYSRQMEPTEAWVASRFKSPYKEANIAALQAGWSYADTAELFHHRIEVPRAEDLPTGRYRNIMGNNAMAIGLVAAANKLGLPLFYGTYPITPASDILHHLAPFKNFGVTTFQAEDEIAGICAAIGASYGGAIGVTGTSGPGLALKGEALGLAVMTELPLVLIDVQRAGPSTGMPTKVEQADLLQAMYGRNGEAPVPVLAPATPSDCFAIAVEAVRIATTYMVPVIVLSDAYVANGAEPWKLPDLESFDLAPVTFRTDPEGFRAYARDEDTLARPWVVPGTPGMEHRIGGLEKENITGNISYDPENHELMCKLRREKVQRVANSLPPTTVYGDEDGVVVLGWGSTFGVIRTAVDACRADGRKVAHVHVRHLNPLPNDLATILRRYDKVLVPEINLGQLVRLIRAEYLIDAIPYNKIQGQPFRTDEVMARIEALFA